MMKGVDSMSMPEGSTLYELVNTGITYTHASVGVVVRLRKELSLVKDIPVLFAIDQVWQYLQWFKFHFHSWLSTGWLNTAHKKLDCSFLWFQYNSWFTFSEYEEPVTVRSCRPIHAKKLSTVSDVFYVSLNTTGIVASSRTSCFVPSIFILWALDISFWSNNGILSCMDLFLMSVVSLSVEDLVTLNWFTLVIYVFVFAVFPVSHCIRYLAGNSSLF